MSAVSDRRRTCAAMWCTLFVGLLLVSCSSAMESNDNQDDANNLGLLTSACADNFCKSGVSGLDLWLSLEAVCNINTQPYMESLMSTRSTVDLGGWPVSVAAFVWVGVWMVSMYAGYRSGMKVGSQNKGLYPVA